MRIIGFPTAIPTSDSYFLMDSVDGGSQAVSATQLANALFSMIDLSELTINKGLPVGEIISYMGTIAPENYLICDGTEYLIEDYPDLTQHFLDNFGSVNYFGGDGETVFAVPDLRGEFLRGSGINGHINEGNGRDVGLHQGSTIIPRFEYFNNGSKGFFNVFGPKSSGTNSMISPSREDFNLGSSSLNCYIPDINNFSNDYEKTPFYTIRPTNTSVLYCIRYKS